MNVLQTELLHDFDQIFNYDEKYKSKRTEMSRVLNQIQSQNKNDIIKFFNTIEVEPIDVNYVNISATSDTENKDFIHLISFLADSVGEYSESKNQQVMCMRLLYKFVSEYFYVFTICRTTYDIVLTKIEEFKHVQDDFLQLAETYKKNMELLTNN